MAPVRGDMRRSERVCRRLRDAASDAEADDELESKGAAFEEELLGVSTMGVHELGGVRSFGAGPEKSVDDWLCECAEVDVDDLDDELLLRNQASFRSSDESSFAGRLSLLRALLAFTSRGRTACFELLDALLAMEAGAFITVERERFVELSAEEPSASASFLCQLRELDLAAAWVRPFFAEPDDGLVRDTSEAQRNISRGGVGLRIDAL